VAITGRVYRSDDDEPLPSPLDGGSAL
jgi:hypothetical protein